MIPGGHVFISYSRRDKEFVERLGSDLRAMGFTPWLDVENITPGSNWQAAIVEAVGSAAAFIYVISREALRSAFMSTELAHFAARGKPVIPVIIEDVDVAELPPALAALQWADFRDAYESGMASLARALSAVPRADNPVPAVRPQSKGYVFLSYAEEDADFAGELKVFLRDHGYAYWDYEESDRDYHCQLFLELEGVILEAAATLSVLSESWKRSEWAVKEFFFSQEAGIPVFLLRAKRMGPTLAVAGLMFVDFTVDRSDGFKKLDRELARKGL